MPPDNERDGEDEDDERDEEEEEEDKLEKECGFGGTEGAGREGERLRGMEEEELEREAES